MSKEVEELRELIAKESWTTGDMFRIRELAAALLKERDDLIEMIESTANLMRGIAFVERSLPDRVKLTLWSSVKDLDDAVEKATAWEES